MIGRNRVVVDKAADDAREFADVLGHALAYDLAGLEKALEGEPSRELARELARARGYAYDLASVLDVARAQGRIGGRTLNSALALDSALDSALGRARDLLGDQALGQEIELLQAGGRTLARHVTGLRRRPVAVAAKSSSTGVVVARASSRLTVWAVRLVPPAHRAEYEEDFRAEVYEVAAAGAGWWGQVRHCLRVLVRVPLLRQELLAPAPSTRERSW